MKIRFRREEDEQVEAEVRDLSTLGAFVISNGDEPAGESQFELRVADGWLVLPGEVVRITEEGFAVVFNALPSETLNQLAQAISGEGKEESSAEPEPEPQEVLPEQVTVAGTDWEPPVSEPVLHQWRPETDFPKTDPALAKRVSWADLPTVSPTIANQTTAREAEEQQKAAQEQLARKRAAQEQAARQKAAQQQAAQQQAAQQQAARQQAAQQQAAQQQEAQQQAARQQAAPQQAPQQGAADSPAPSGKDLRETYRHERSIPVSFDNLTGLIKEFTHNISYGGMFVYTKTPLPARSETAVTLIHPVHGERLTLLARVVHGSQAPSADPASGEQRFGVGLEFKLPLDELKRMLADFIGSHQKQDQQTPVERVVSQAKQMMARGQDSPKALLGIEPGAGANEARQAYFKLVDRFHPDRYFGKVGAEERKLLEELFRSLTKAYEELTA